MQAKGQDFIAVEEENEDPEKPTRKIYEQVHSHYFNTKYQLADEIKINGVYHGREEMMEENKGQGFCYVIPDGLVQDVLVHLTRRLHGEPESRASFKITPFFGKFEYFEGHVKPERQP